MEYYGVAEWAELERVLVLLFVLLYVHFFNLLTFLEYCFPFSENISSLLFPAGVSPFLLALFGLHFLLVVFTVQWFCFYLTFILHFYLHS